MSNTENAQTLDPVLQQAAQEFMDNNKGLMQDLAKQEEAEKTPVPEVNIEDSTAQEKRVLPELVFNNLAGKLYQHSEQLTREQAVRALQHAIAFPLEHERLPKLKGKHTKLTFQIAVRMFDAKLLMFYNYMKQAETSTVEDVDKLIADLTEKRIHLVKLENETKLEGENKNG